MFHVRNQTLETTLEAAFPAAVPFDSAKLKSVALKALEKFRKYDLRPNEVLQRPGDQLFDYGLFFNLFNNQANFRLTSDRLVIRIQGAKNKQDAEILADTLISSGQCLESEVDGFNIQSMAHAVFDVESDGVKYLETFVDETNQIIDGGRTVVVKQPGWETPVRVSVEKSLAVKNGIFLAWSTDQKGPVSLENIKIIADKFAKAVNSLGLTYRIE